MADLTTSRQFVRRTSSVTVQLVVTRLLSLVYLYFVARVLVEQQRREVASLTMFLTIVAAVSLLSLSAFQSVKIPLATSRGNMDTVRGDLQFISGFAGGVTIAVAIASALLSSYIFPILYLELQPSVILLFLLVVATLVPTNLLSITSNTLLGLNRIGKMALVNGVNAVLTYGFALALILPPFSLGSLGVVLAWLVAAVAALLLSLYYLRDIFRLRRASRHSLSEIVRFCTPLWIGGIALTMNPWVDQYLVLSTLGDALGNYYYAARLVQITVAVLGSVAITFLPAISEARGVGDDRMSVVFDTTMKFTIYIAAIITAGMIVFANTIFVALLGEDFLVCLNAFQILSVVVFFQTINGLLVGVLLAENRPTITLESSGSQLVVAAVVGILIVPPLAAISSSWGMMAAATTSVVGYLVNSTVCYYFLRRDTHLRIASRTITVGVLAAALSSLVMFCLSVASSVPSYAFLDGTVGLFITVYVPGLMFLKNYIIGGLGVGIQILVFVMGLLLYCFLLLLLKGFQRQDFIVARRALPRRFGGLVNWLQAVAYRLHRIEPDFSTKPRHN
jgi:O-antigen/teichoic acid export membrane protein